MFRGIKGAKSPWGGNESFGSAAGYQAAVRMRGLVLLSAILEQHVGNQKGDYKQKSQTDYRPESPGRP